jgi:hypothetical protein
MEFIKKNIIAICLFLLTTVGGFTWNLIKKGGDVEFNEKVEAVVSNQLKSAEFMTKVMNSPFMIDYKKQQRAELIKEALHKDSSKVKMSSYLSLKTGMTKTSVMDSLVVLLHGMKRGRPINENECILITKKYIRNTPTF